MGAAVAAAKVADEVGLTISVIGTPAEEVGNASGKILMLERGGFDGIHAAMMVHPAPFDMLRAKIIAASMFEVQCTGKESHASAFPELGVNAADALTIAQTALGLLRQHIRSTDRIHGIVTNGGAAPNVVPAHTSAKYIIRSETLDQLAELRPKVYRCFEAGGLATGAKVQITGGDKPYAEMLHDDDMAALYRANSEALGTAISESGGVGDAADGIDGYGECLTGDAVDPSDDRDQFAAGGESSAGVHGALRDGGRGQGADRRCDGDGVDVRGSGEERRRCGSG